MNRRWSGSRAGERFPQEPGNLAQNARFPHSHSRPRQPSGGEDQDEPALERITCWSACGTACEPSLHQPSRSGAWPIVNPRLWKMPLLRKAQNASHRSLEISRRTRDSHIPTADHVNRPAEKTRMNRRWSGSRAGRRAGLLASQASTSPRAARRSPDPTRARSAARRRDPRAREASRVSRPAASP
jgi:hypothetical protein